MNSDQLQALRDVFSRRTGALRERAARVVRETGSRHAPEGLVHEAFIRLVESDAFETHVLAWAQDEMRRIATEEGVARREHDRVPLSRSDRVEQLVDVLINLLSFEGADVSDIVDLKVRGGLSDEAVAEELGLTRAGVSRSFHRVEPMLEALGNRAE